ncbi:MAG: TPM domain-containing protein [Spirochaetia bacterium]|nr:TPM domain-containing protein [Spirochaetia bacterium]
MLFILALPGFISAEIPKSSGFVTDLSGVINSSDKEMIEAAATEVRDKTGAEIAVLTVKTIEPYGSIEEFALDTASQWGIGEKGKDNGVLIVVSTGERKLRIEVGYGLEGAIPDGLAGSIMDDYMVPYLRSNDYSSGLKTGFIAVASLVAKEYNIEIEGSSYRESLQSMQTGRNSSGSSGGGMSILFIIFILFISGGRLFWPLIFLSSMSGRRGYGGGFGSSFGGGGGFSGGFGGGGFGGGGASRGF